MADIQLVGEILIKRQEQYSDEEIADQLAQRGYIKTDVTEAIDAIDNGFIFSVKTIVALTPFAPITYRFGIRRIEKVTNILWGLIRDTKDVGVKVIDKVQVQRRIIDASVSIFQAERDDIEIAKITRRDAEKIRMLYASVIESQRRSVINVSQD